MTFKVQMTLIDLRRTDGSDDKELQALIGSKFEWNHSGPFGLIALDAQRSEIRRIFNDNDKVEAFHQECLARQ